MESFGPTVHLPVRSFFDYLAAFYPLASDSTSASIFADVVVRGGELQSLDDINVINFEKVLSCAPNLNYASQKFLTLFVAGASC